jgi:thiol-disulfide isomerase/thioredoxin
MNELVVISAVWCPSCLILNKNLKKLNEENLDIKINKLDFDLDEDEVEEYNVGDKLPVVVFKKDNQEVSRLIGEKSYDELLTFIKENI